MDSLLQQIRLSQTQIGPILFFSKQSPYLSAIPGHTATIVIRIKALTYVTLKYVIYMLYVYLRNKILNLYNFSTNLSQVHFKKRARKRRNNPFHSFSTNPNRAKKKDLKMKNGNGFVRPPMVMHLYRLNEQIK